MKRTDKTKKFLSILALIFCNIVLVVAIVFYAVHYSRTIHEQKEESMRESFCNSVDALRQISEMYLDSELDRAKSWVAYIEQEHMTKDGALSYIAALDDQTNSEAHIVNMDTFDAWSTHYTGEANSIDIYRNALLSEDQHIHSIIDNMQKIFAGEKRILSKYKVNESQRIFISVGTRVILREADDSDAEYLLLRAIPIEYMKERWLFPLSFSSAQIGLIATNYDYIISSNAMRSETFIDFVRSYNFPDDYFGADRYLVQIQTQENGMMELNDSRGQPCYWYYSRLDGYADADILGYVPVSALADDAENLSVAYIVAAGMFVLLLIDGAYILNINRKLRETAKIAKQANLAKTQFLSTMSHDIRTPLNAVLGMTELAQSKIDNKEYVRDCLAKVTISGNHLLTLINDILEISRVESGKIHLNPEPFSVRSFVSNLESLTRSQATGHGLQFEVEVGGAAV